MRDVKRAGVGAWTKRTRFNSIARMRMNVRTCLRGGGVLRRRFEGGVEGLPRQGCELGVCLHSMIGMISYGTMGVTRGAFWDYGKDLKFWITTALG